MEGKRVLPRRVGVALVVLFSAWAVGTSVRPLFVLDETRYASVAWEMYESGDWLVPHLNGKPYADKPPLLFWLACLGWKVFGVKEWWLRIVPFLFGAASAVLLFFVARSLYGSRTAVRSSLFLLSCYLWVLWSGLLMFDLVLSFFVLAAVSGVFAYAERGGRWWYLTAVGTAGGILSKGPVVLLFVVPAIVVSVLWRWRTSGYFPWRRCGILALAAVTGCVLVMLWVVPAILHGGSSYADQILWRQNFGRISHAFTHRHPWWFYAAALPVLLLPWGVCPSAIKSFRCAVRTDATAAAIAVWLIVVFLLFSAVQSKQIHYLLPLLPFFSLLAARGVDESGVFTPGRIVAAVSCWSAALLLFFVPAVYPSVQAYSFVHLGIVSVLLVAGAVSILLRLREDDALLGMAVFGMVCILSLEFGGVVLYGEGYDLRNLAFIVSERMAEGRPVAHVGAYSGQLHFYGRLGRPIEEVPPGKAMEWLSSHRRGVLVVSSRHIDDIPPDAVRLEYAGPYFRRWILLLSPLSPEVRRMP